jgi:hypothetical protein
LRFSSTSLLAMGKLRSIDSKALRVITITRTVLRDLQVVVVGGGRQDNTRIRCLLASPNWLTVPLLLAWTPTLSCIHAAAADHTTCLSQQHTHQRVMTSSLGRCHLVAAPSVWT